MAHLKSMMQNMRSIGVFISLVVIIIFMQCFSFPLHKVQALPDNEEIEIGIPGLIESVDIESWAQECLEIFKITGGITGPLPPFTDESRKTACNGCFQNFTYAPSYPSPFHISEYLLHSLPSGQCTEWLSCGFEYCDMSNQTFTFLKEFDPSSTKQDDFEALQDVLIASGSSLNLPSYVAFPTSVADISLLLQFASKHKIPISIKNTGHSYPGSSMQKNTLQINMRDFPKTVAVPYFETYIAERCASNEMYQTICPSGVYPSILSCDFVAEEAKEKDLMGCQAIQSRNLNGLLRASASDNWNDAYKAVENANGMSAPLGNIYSIVGGGVGTVGATGGWVQGSGLSTGMERLYGFGADNVVQIEMVLANGEHIKFAPTAFDNSTSTGTGTGNIYPFTTNVTGYCNANLTADEADWSWETCDPGRVPVPFEDLWYAVRGGGGGAYGVVTHVTYQLHTGLDTYSPMIFDDDVWTKSYSLYVNNTDNAEVVEAFTTLQNMIIDFMISFLWEPESLGISEDISNKCGGPDMQLVFPYIVRDGFGDFRCYDDGAEEFSEAWSSYWSTNPIPEALRCSINNSSEDIGDEEACIGTEEWRSAWSTKMLNGEPFRSSASQQLVDSASGSYKSNWPVGTIYSGEPNLVPVDIKDLSSVYIPKEWILERSEGVYDVLSIATAMHITGGLVNQTSDNMDALSIPQRLSGYQANFPYEILLKYLPTWQTYWPSPSSSSNHDGNAISGGADYNHIAPNAMGPLKSDTSKPCPVKELSYAEAEEACLSVQEFAFGTEGLERLESIKNAVDPHSLFMCQKCVGFDKEKMNERIDLGSI